jgi:hypothetical protein
MTFTSRTIETELTSSQKEMMWEQEQANEKLDCNNMITIIKRGDDVFILIWFIEKNRY